MPAPTPLTGYTQTRTLAVNVYTSTGRAPLYYVTEGTDTELLASAEGVRVMMRNRLSGAGTGTTPPPPIPPTITTTSPLPDAIVGEPYSYQLAATGGTPPYTWQVTSGNLTGYGLALSATGLISGTVPTMMGGMMNTFEVRATDSVATQSAPVTLNISFAYPVTPGLVPNAPELFVPPGAGATLLISTVGIAASEILMWNAWESTYDANIVVSMSDMMPLTLTVDVSVSDSVASGGVFQIEVTAVTQDLSNSYSLTIPLNVI
jgi:hypothetical protein